MAKFICKYPNYKIMVKPSVRQVVNGILVHTPGEFVKFENGELVTENKAHIAFLKKHRDFGIVFFEDKPQAQG